MKTSFDSVCFRMLLALGLLSALAMLIGCEQAPPWKFEQWFYLGATTFYIPNTNGSVSNSKGLKLKDFNSDMIRYHQRHYEMPRRYFYRFGDAPKLYSEYMDSLNL